MLSKLDQAAKGEQTTAVQATSAAAPTPADQAEEEGVMDLDDEVFDQMAEAAVPPAAEGDKEEDRTARVAETKARLKAKKDAMESGLAGRVKVRKLAKK